MKACHCTVYSPGDAILLSKKVNIETHSACCFVWVQNLVYGTQVECVRVRGDHQTAENYTILYGSWCV